MVLKVFITGEPGIGKTTCIRRVVDALAARGIGAGGMITNEMRDGTTRIGFEVRNLLTGQVGVLASVAHRGPRVGKYGVNLSDLDAIGAAAIEKAISRAQLVVVVVVDEVGPMELCSVKFVSAVQRAIQSAKPILGSIHRNARHPVIDLIRSRQDVRKFTLDRSNRDRIVVELTEEFGKSI